MNLSVREFKKKDIHRIVDYFLTADDDFLSQMGVDKNKLPQRERWMKMLLEDREKNYADKEYYYLIWLLDAQPIGHSNINNILFGQSATMHLHIWEKDKRQRGLGVEFLKRCIKLYFENFKLEKIICEPYAENPAPNRTLLKLGFTLIRSYETIPGWINFRQKVNRYELTKAQFTRIERSVDGPR